MIKAVRINKFLAKIQTNKRQRRSISYFRRYTVDDLDIVIDARLSKQNDDLQKAKTEKER